MIKQLKIQSKNYSRIYINYLGCKTIENTELFKSHTGRATIYMTYWGREHHVNNGLFNTIFVLIPNKIKFNITKEERVLYDRRTTTKNNSNTIQRILSKLENSSFNKWYKFI